MFVKKITSIYKRIALAINKLEKTRHNRPSLVYPLNVQELISGLTVRSGFMKLINKGFLIVNKNNKLFYRKADLVLFYFDQGLFPVDEIIDEMINLCCQVSSNIILFYNDYEKNLNPHSIKKVTFKKDDVTEIYKDIIKALHSIELQALKKSLINTDAIIKTIEDVESDIDLLSESVAIVKGQKKFTYYDIVLIMTRFHCGLTRLLYVIRDIQSAIDRLDRAIEDEQELPLKENNNHVGVKK